LLPGFEVIEATLNEFNNYKKEQPEPDAIFYFPVPAGKLL
jgi:hypothetical protein